jgi:hypothetical protein
VSRHIRNREQNVTRFPPERPHKALFVLNHFFRTDKPPLAGFAAEDNQQLTLRLFGQNSVVTKSEILSREKSPISMMPLVHATA